MPSADKILAGLEQIANDAWLGAMAWHGLVALAAIALLLGWRPSRRLAAVLLVAPLASVSALAWIFGNPFNGASFAVLAAALLAFARKAAAQPVARAPAWATIAGVAMLAFGWVYPHFLAASTPVAYVYAAPLGLIPCPTLSAVIGFALLGGGLGALNWSLTLAGAGVFYAIFGVVRLGVSLDLPLLGGAVALIVVATRPAAIPDKRTHRPTPT